MKKTFALFALLLCAVGMNAQNDYINGQSIWFDKPTTLNGRAIWYGGRPDLWKGKEKPEWAGDAAYNADQEWESYSLPIGNGSIGANIMGSLEAERITLNEKTLWRGGPNTEKGAEYYWNVNKQSAHLLDDIRQAFIDGDEEKAAKLTRENFNSTASYEYYGEKPFRFGNFTTMGEIYIETGHSMVGLGDYKRILSLDSALAVVQYTKDGVQYERKSFVSYPANVLVMKFSASKPGMQNLTLSYAPNPVSEGTLHHDSYDGFIWKAKLDNNGMQHTVHIKAIAKAAPGKCTYTLDDGKIHISGADEVCFYITADTDYKINYDPDFSDPKAYVGVNPDETTKAWIKNAVKKGYDELFKEHYADYSALFNRVKLDINPNAPTTLEFPAVRNLPTDKRLASYRTGKPDYALEQLYSSTAATC